MGLGKHKTFPAFIFRALRSILGMDVAVKNHGH